MAAQAAHIADTIAGMKRVIAKHQDSSDSEEPYLQPTNRGNKLKRKAHHLANGHWRKMQGPYVYKKTIEHNGYQRPILRRNPKRYDEDGDELADSDSDEEADARAAEENPYAEVYLETLLLPLVSAADLPSHPSLSVAYTSPSLTNMARHACDMVQRERKTLANAKRLMTRLRGDQTWIPCGLLCSEMDEGIFNTEKVYNGIVSHKSSHRINGFTAQILLGHGERDESQSDSRNGSSNGTELGSSNVEAKDIEIGPVAESSSTGVKVGQKNEVLVEEPTDDSPKEMSIEETNAGHDVEITDTRPESLPKDPDNAKADEVVSVVGAEISTTNGPLQDAAMHQADGGSYNESENTNSFVSPNPAQRADRVNNDSGTVLASENISNNHLPTPEPDEPGNEESEEANVGQDTSQAAPRRMRTRAQAQAASEPTASTRNESPESWVPPDIHPLFKIPDSAVPDKDFGLPKAEADETRRLLTMYTQKQEEVCRGAEKLYDGLLQADRQRMMVFKWCKADAHVGEMSDGEDWYDKEEWGLEEDLEKGHNDEDGDTNAIQGKKTRGRRA